MQQSFRLTISGLDVRAVNVPMRIPLQTSSGTITTAPLALLDLRTAQGVIGRTYLFCYTPLVLQPVCELLRNLESVILGLSVAPLEIDRMLHSPVFACSAVRASLVWPWRVSTWPRGTP